MNRFLRLFMLGICLMSITVAWARVPLPLLSKKNSTSFTTVLKNTMPAVVNIVNYAELPMLTDSFLKNELKRLPGNALTEDKHFVGLGSGVIIDAKKGLIVTNAHVVDLAKNIIVTLSDGRHFEATKLGADNDSDIAVLQIKADHLTAIPWGDSNKINVGDMVAAIGSPFGLNQTVTSGIISATHRGNLGIEGLENFIQTDASINMGNSGGALINMQGELIGINTALLSGSGGNIGIGFAIPSNMVKSIVIQIEKFGQVNRGIMGVLVQTITPDLIQSLKLPAKTQGALISQILPNSPASKSNIQVGDVIVSINGQAVTSNGDVRNIIGLLRIGETAKITLLRDGKTITTNITPIDSTAQTKNTEQNNPYLYGVKMQEVTVQDPTYGQITGIKVLDLQDYSPAFIAGIQKGDIITAANQTPVQSISALMKMAKLKNDHGLLLNVFRHNGGSIFMVIK